jgi:putative selenium metabolism protein SsnA
MLITNGRIITWEEQNRILEGMAIRIADDRIAEIGPQEKLIANNPDLDQVNANGQYVMPGNICAHTHFYGAYARGMAIPGPAPKDFPEILEKLWWPLDKSLNMGDVRASAEVMLVDAIKHGTTTLIDHHASPSAIDGSLDEIADAVGKAGLRSVLCYEVTDRDGKDKAQAGIKENVRFSNRLNSGEDLSGRLAGTFGLHASLTLSDETLEACRAAAPTGNGFHIHVAEHEADEYDSLGKSGMRVVDRLDKHGILGSKTIVAHVVHIDIEEARTLAEAGTWVTHQPRSNMNNGVGVAPIEGLLRAGINVGIGTDGFSHTMWDEWKAAYLLHKVWNRDPRRFSGLDAVQLGVYNNAALANQFFPQAEIGRLIPGAFADIIFGDYHPHTPLTEGNLPWQIIFGFNESMVTTTIVAGEVLMQDRKLLTLDEEAITSSARLRAPEVWARYNTFVPS